VSRGTTEVGACRLFVFVDPIERIRGIAERVAGAHGLEIFDVQMRRETIGPVLRIVIDSPPPADGSPQPVEDAVGIQDCQRISEDISAILDVEAVIDHRYTLEVSSPGLDRLLRHAGDYRRFAGRKAKVVLSEPVDGQMHYKGRLRGVENDAVLLDDEQGRPHRVRLELITRARLEVEF
jgi:ribosome maturation factor RimP